MKISIRKLRGMLIEQLMSEGPEGGLGKLLDDVSAQFVVKMQEMYPSAGDLIQQEANALKTQLMATIKASAAKVKMSASS